MGSDKLRVYGGAELKDGNTAILDLRSGNPEEIVRRAMAHQTPGSARGKTLEDHPGGKASSRTGAGDVAGEARSPARDANAGVGRTDSWVPWFPVIDYDRCRNCKQCMGFCLFGVYETDGDGRVAVKNPRGCKTNCPACARICPEIAIMFPKYSDSPINGAEIADEDTERANVRIGVKEILGDDPYAALQQRKIKRQLLIRQRDKDKAEAEREKHNRERT